MGDYLLLIIFIVTFYFVFKTIWNNVTTISHSGLNGFFSSWLSQLIWAGFIAGVVTLIASKIMESITSFGRGLDPFNILCGGFLVMFIYATFFSENKPLDKRTFLDNYNRNVAELKEKRFHISDYLDYIDKYGNPGNLIDVDDVREGSSLFLAEEFVSTGSSTLIKFPSLRINHNVSKNGTYTSIKLSLRHLTCDDEMGRVGIAFMEKLIAEITFTAAIESVAKGKGRAIENALSLINEHGAFGFLEYDCDSGKTATRNYAEDGIEYIVSRNSNGDVSLKMLKKTSDGK